MAKKITMADKEDFSVLELQNMLDNGGEITAEAAPLSPEIRAKPRDHKFMALNVGALHALDLEPVNSKVVVILDQNKPKALLATPAMLEPKVLPEGDPAHKLPEGARIRKVEEEKYIGEQLNAVEMRPPLVRDTAAAVISEFVKHFHL